MVPLHHGWGWYPPQTASHILIRHIKSVWAIGMLSQGHMVAPLYRYTGQVGPRFGKSGSLVEWKRCHNIIVEADIQLRLLHTSIVDIYKVFKLLVCCLKEVWVHPYTVTLAKLALDLGSQDHLWSENDATTSWLRLISTSDCFIHPYWTYTKCLRHWHAVSRAYGCTLIVTLAKLPPDLGIQIHLRSGSDATTSWLRLIFTSDHFIHPYKTYTKCLSYWYAVSRAYGCTLIPLHWPSCSQIWEFSFTWGVEMMPQRHNWGWYSPQTT